MVAAMSVRERQKAWRERRKETHTRLGDVWLPQDVVMQLDEIAAYHSLTRIEMLETVIRDSYAAWSEKNRPCEL